MLNPRLRLSRTNFRPSISVAAGMKFPVKVRLVIDTSSVAMLPLLVLETALLPPESARQIGKETIVSSIIKEWNRHSDN